MRKTRVLLLTQWFDPEPTFKGLLFARELVKLGFEVEVLTGFPNYPGGKVYPGYRIRPVCTEEIDGVRVVRVALYPSHSRSAIGRVANYVSFAASACLYGMLGARRPDVIYAYHPPATIGIAATLIRWVRGGSVVMDIQDLWPDTLRATGMVRNPRVLAAVDLVCKWLYRKVDRVVVLSPGFKRLLIERGVPPEKVEVIFNWADESAVSASGADSPAGFPAEGFRVLFAGNMGVAQQLDVAISAAALLAERCCDAKFVFLGGGIDAQRLSARAESMGLENVRFLPPVPMSQVGPYLRHADALLVHLRPDPLFEITIPSKTQAYLAAGRPILMGVGGDAAELVVRSGAGIAFAPGSPEALANSVERLMSLSDSDRATMGKRGADFYERHLCVARGVEAFARVFASSGQRNSE